VSRCDGRSDGAARLAPRTRKVLLHWVGRVVRLCRVSPDRLTTRQVRAFLLHRGSETAVCARGLPFPEAASEHRDDHVIFSYKDRSHGGKRKSQTVSGLEFARRFLSHVVPSRFVRVRHYGVLANAFRCARLATVRVLLGSPAPPEPAGNTTRGSWQQTYSRIVGTDPLRCPACGTGLLVVVQEIPPSASLAKSALTSRSP
jgi:hypothetical protein